MRKIVINLRICAVISHWAFISLNYFYTKDISHLIKIKLELKQFLNKMCIFSTKYKLSYLFDNNNYIIITNIKYRIIKVYWIIVYIVRYCFIDTLINISYELKFVNVHIF